MNKKIIIIISSVFLVIFLTFFFLKNKEEIKSQEINNLTIKQTPSPSSIPKIKITGKNIFSLYSTAQTTSYKPRMENIVKIAKETKINSVIINVKDGTAVYLGENIRKTVDLLKKEGIIPIARIATFQDNEFAEENSSVALRDKNGQLLNSDKYYWVDPASRVVWNRNVEIAIKAIDLGFEEVNFDYFRFPTPKTRATSTNDIIYPVYNFKTSKEEVIANAAAYVTSQIRKQRPGIIISVDVFAYSFIQEDDLGVGQRITKLGKYFDVVCPMVYPSHYTPGNFGFKNPADHPYEVVLETIKAGQEQFKKENINPIIRPWIQDFNIGAIYDVEMIKKEIQAVVDSGVSGGWMVWSPSNNYNQKSFQGVE